MQRDKLDYKYNDVSRETETITVPLMVCSHKRLRKRLRSQLSGSVHTDLLAFAVIVKHGYSIHFFCVDNTLTLRGQCERNLRAITLATK